MLRSVFAVAALVLAVSMARVSAGVVLAEADLAAGFHKNRAAGDNPNIGRLEMRRALERDPWNAQAMVELAQLLSREGNRQLRTGVATPAALEQLRESLQILDRARPVFSMPSFLARTRGETADMLSVLQSRSGNRAEAEALNSAALAEFLEVHRLTHRVRVNEGVFLRDVAVAASGVGRPDLVCHFGRLLELHSDGRLRDSRGWSDLVLSARQLTGDLAGVFGELRRRVRKDPRDPAAIVALSQAALGLGRPQEAALLLRELDARQQLGPTGRETLARLDAAVRQQTEAAAFSPVVIP